ncbi:SpoIIE family protein phosphatase [Halomonas sp. 18H]|uniref:PP2C family protein-serine/threonine phosphatase n=1 Tax=Halomonas almeriensis TaxID=308163 RepID=UPI00222E6D9A|nr:MULTISPECIES: response regulator [Halomonas]MCW4151034.1 SpoIIE family protein phosphatase [Halomonas sp. 18H]MDN3552914.1 SpoIIE family protein phosphatase [Halomonas almeriensis]
MSSDNELIGLVDLPGDERDALAGTIARDGLAVFAAAEVDQLPEETVLVVAHSRAVAAQDWPALCRRLPTLVVSDDRQDSELFSAVDAGLVDYVVDPLRHGHLLRRMIRRVIEINRLAREQEHDRRRLGELNEHLETHLAMLRLDQQAGGQIQRKLLPPTPNYSGNVRCDYWLAPSLYLSGDFLDFLHFDERFTLFYFADVSGHGASSAFVTVLLKYLFNRWQSEWDGRDPKAIGPSWLSALNRELLDTGIGKHATLFVGVIDREQRYLHYSLGSQFPMPMLVSGDGLVALEGEGMPVGLFPDVEYPSLGCHLPDDFRLWLCSDGILECLPGDTLDERLEVLGQRAACCESLMDLTASLALGERVEGNGVAEDEANGDELPDDLTIMMLSGFGDDKA